LDVAIDTQSDLVSGVADLRRVPLGQLSDSARGAVGSTLNRVVAGKGGGGGAVAPFDAFTRPGRRVQRVNLVRLALTCVESNLLRFQSTLI
jgi:hypothetical protein